MPAGNLHAYAVGAEQNLEKLATGLAQAGVDEQTIGVVSQMADVTRKLVVALGKGQEQTGDNEPPAQEGPPQRHTMDSGAAALHQDMQRSAYARR